jgi:radical SAM superfamily enzyme YgiQ (UPF0313 family)
MRMLFFIPRTKSFIGTEKNIPKHPPLGIACLSAFLKEHHIEVKAFDEGVETGVDSDSSVRDSSSADSHSKISQLIKDFKPDLIGVQALSFNYVFFTDLIRRIKKITDTPVVVGGPHVSATFDEVLRNTPADLAAFGEGEITLLELINELKTKKPELAKINGLIWRKGKKIITNAPRELIKDINILPIPDFTIFRLPAYSYYSEKKLPLATSRGCPFNCNFCSVKLSFGRSFRPKSSEQVMKEIEHYLAMGYDHFDVLDDCFNLSIVRVMDICDRIIKKRLKIKLEFYNGLRADRITPEMIRTLKRAGCLFIALGAESAHDETLLRIGKNLRIESVKKAAEIINRAGIPCSACFIIGHPGEDYAKSLETIRFAKSLPCVYVNFYNLIPYPGTTLYDWVEKNGRFLIPKKDYYKYVSGFNIEPIFETDDFPAGLRKKALHKGLLLYRKRSLQYKFGKPLGTVLYFLLINDKLYEMALKFGLWSKFGARLYDMLTARGNPD